MFGNFIGKINCDFLNPPHLQKKIIEITYSNWLDLILKNDCQGFHYLIIDEPFKIIDESFKISASSKRIKKGKNQKGSK